MNKRWLILGGVFALVLAASAGVFFMLSRANPFPADIRTNAITPLYYPASLPPGFKRNSDSFSQKRGVTLFNFDAPDGNKLNFTIQKVPTGYNFDQLYRSNMEQTQTINIELGAVHIGNLGENTMAHMIIDDTWIMAVYSQSNANNDVMSVMKSLKRY